MDVDYLKKHLKGNVTIICHHNADPDAIGAAFGLQRLIQILDPNAVTEILYPDSASQLSDKIITHLKIEASTQSKITDPNTKIFVDVGSLVQIENLKPLLYEKNSAKIFIDHHSRDPEIAKIASLYILDENAVAASEIVFEIWNNIGLEPDPAVAQALLVGIVFDSKHFSIGTPRVFRIVARLLEFGASLNGVKELLSSSMDQSEKLARLKAAQRMTIHRLDQWIIATSDLGSFQSSAARSILSLGADVVIIAGNDKTELQASFRSTEEFYLNTKIHLGEDITKPLAEQFKGAGGGHPTAAGVNAFGKSEMFLLKAVELIKEKLKARCPIPKLV